MPLSAGSMEYSIKSRANAVRARARARAAPRRTRRVKSPRSGARPLHGGWPFPSNVKGRRNACCCNSCRGRAKFYLQRLPDCPYRAPRVGCFRGDIGLSQCWAGLRIFAQCTRTSRKVPPARNWEAGPGRGRAGVGARGNRIWQEVDERPESALGGLVSIVLQIDAATPLRLLLTTRPPRPLPHLVPRRGCHPPPIPSTLDTARC
ncbi:hypothetical protein OH77DRAFT_550329 [Trametes cingulata]|nr:hypothetical protein OH77DRAFT_550329 [Trametes cingulata]